MIEYRQSLHTDTWHWRPDCSGWPTGYWPGPSGYLAHAKKPPISERCRECADKDRAGPFETRSRRGK